MAEMLSEIEAIANQSEAPTFENTIAEIERAGQSLNRVRTIYSIWGSNMNSPECQAVQQEMAPRLAAFSDQMTQNETLFALIVAVYNDPTNDIIKDEQQSILWDY